jgi:hydrogenase maturation protein HypF
LKTYQIDITGIVQGVGFRPFLFNLARANELKGCILNRGNAGVRILLQGHKANLDLFLTDLSKKKPEISYIERISIKEIESNELYEDLAIIKSEEGRGISLTLPPDIAMCEDCIKDMRNPSLPKYYNYPFVACAVCGPRYTTVQELPYDRERTTMRIFPFCKNAEPESCLSEYSDFNNRRFHAQTFACSVCGPHYQLFDNAKIQIASNSIKEILERAATIVNEGHVLAVKGIGGVHLVCLANDDLVISKIRTRKGKRKNKPFAVMIPDIKLIEDEFMISKKEKNILLSFRRPIVLLEKKIPDCTIISENVAPGLNNVGFMFPYSGIHHLLFDYIGRKPLVYTSGNKSYIPMAIHNDEIFNQLKDIADYFLLHNRPIHQRVDDSVLRVHENKVKLIRRSRGYVPEYIPLPFTVDIPAAMATGPLLSTTGAILRYNRIFPTQHIGNVTHLETYNFLNEALFHLKNLLKVRDDEITFIACDAHPGFITTKYGRELSEQFNVPVFSIAHHYAHSLGLMAENNVLPEERIISITTDGVGYGPDGNIWGGEILNCSYQDFERVGSLEYQPMIGGDRCTKYPARMVASILLKTLGVEDAGKLFIKLNLQKDLEYGNEELKTIIELFKKANGDYKQNQIPLTSSTGRIFDSVSYLLGVCSKKTYRGEPAMRLEGFATKVIPEHIPLEIEIMNDNQINTSQLILDIIDLIDNLRFKRADIASKFHYEIAKAFAKVAIKEAEKNHIEKIGLTGGVAYNNLFSKTIKELIVGKHMQFLEHNIIPPGDAGISIGQLISGLFSFLKN